MKPTNDHRLSEANQHQQSARTSRNRPIRHQESGGKSYGTDTANDGRKATTQWTSRSCATPEIADEFHQMDRAHQHDGESCSHGVMERTIQAPGCQCAPTAVLTNTFQLAQRTRRQPGRHSTGCVHRVAGQE